MFHCKHGTPHQHSTVLESKICWGIIAPARPTSVIPPAPPAPAVRMSSPRQRSWLSDLGHPESETVAWTYDQASAKITELTTSAPRRPRMSDDPRLPMVKALIEMVPDGYYAVQAESGAHIDFLRISRPKKRQYAGTTKIQTQHGPNLDVEAVLWPSGQWSIYKRGVIDMLMLLVADSHTAARRYATKKGRCMRCTADLTDRRSRHYGIGPECEKARPWAIEEVDEMNDGHSYEWLAARNLVTVND
jgi:hypothetical protein